LLARKSLLLFHNFYRKSWSQIRATYTNDSSWCRRGL